MGLIKEPLNIDFVVDPRPLTDRERQMISDFIKSHKAKSKKRLGSPKTRVKLTTKLKRKKENV